MNYKEITDKEFIVKEKRKEQRKDISLKEALKGRWKGTDGHVIFFNDKYLKQDEYTFKYVIKEHKKDNIHICVYGLNGYFIRNKKLFDMYIEMDIFRSNIKIKKVMVSNHVYFNEMIYIDKDDYELGEFDSYFFVN